MTHIVEGAAIAAGFARTELGGLVPPARSQSQAVPAWTPRSRNQLRCHVVSRADLHRYPLWRSTFAGLRKDHRYYEILEDTLHHNAFDYRYFVITDAAGDALAIQPCFVMDQDMLEGVAALVPVLARIRKLFPRFMTVRTLMVGCAAGEGHLAASPLISAADIVKVLGAKATDYARSVNAKMVVMKEFPAHYRAACEGLLADGFCRVPSMPSVSLDLTEPTFEAFIKKVLRANARRHLKKNLAATAAMNIEMQVTRAAAPALVEEIHQLYLQVFEKSEFRFEKLTPDFFRRLGEDMGDKVRFFTWRHDGKLIAASMSMLEGRTLYLEYLGLDYEIALDLHLYHYTFRDQYDWAVQNGCTKICSTALGYDPKLHLRFRLDPLDLYVQHVQPLLNLGLQRVLKWMVPARYDETLKKFPNYAELWS
jgi:hypothetical protein